MGLTPHNSKLRVLSIISGDRVGGAERQALLLAKYAKSYNVEIMLVTLLADDAPALGPLRGSILSEAEQSGIATAKLDARSPLSLPAIRRFIKLVRVTKPAVVYTYGLRADLIGRLFSQLAGCPTVVSSIRNLEEQRHTLEVWLDRLSSPLVTLWISNTYAGKERFISRERLPASKIVVVPNGIEERTLPESSGQFRRQWGINDKHFVIGTVANLRPQKGHIEIIKSAQQVADIFPNVRFVFIGDGPLRAELQQEIEARGLVKYIILAGHCNTVYQALAEVDVFLLASYYEGMPNALMEAMLAARSCIATEVGDVGVILGGGRCGVLIPPKDPDEIAKAIVTLAQNPELALQHSQAARQRMLEMYSPEKMAQQVSDTIRAVIQPVVDNS